MKHPLARLTPVSLDAPLDDGDPRRHPDLPVRRLQEAAGGEEGREEAVNVAQRQREGADVAEAGRERGTHDGEVTFFSFCFGVACANG